MDWNKFFEMMIDWKKLPAYKAEPRIDSLVGFFLDSILSDFLNVEIEGIIPEFPLRIGTLKSKHEGTSYADRSYKVDFLAIGKNGINYLVEFKTDILSYREQQYKYLSEAKSLGTKAIVNGALKIASVSAYSKKYNHLKNKMQEFGLTDDTFNYTGKNPELEIIYVQPSNRENKKDVIGFDWIADWLEKEFSEKDTFEREFAATLRIWSKD